MKTLFESMDLFAHKISFNYRKKKDFHSFFGIGLSFILYGLMIYLIYYFSIDFLRSTNPKVTYRETQFEDQHTFPVDSLFSEFSIYIRLNESVYADTNMDEYISKNNNTELLRGIVYLNLISRNKLEYIKVTVESTISLVAKYDCLDYYSQPCLYLGFTWNSNQLNILNITKFGFYLQENQMFSKTSENISYDKSKMLNFTVNPDINLILAVEFTQKFYDKFNFNSQIFTEFHMVDNIINTNEIGFFKQYENVHNEEFSGKDMENAEFEYFEYIYKMVKVRDDKGIIFSSFFENIRFQKDNLYMKKNRIDPLFGIYVASIQFDKVMKHYDRVYRKLQNIFADIGGIFNSFLLIGHVIIFQFNNKKFNYDLINMLFDSEEEQVEAYGKNLLLNSKIDFLSSAKNPRNHHVNKSNLNKDSCSENKIEAQNNYNFNDLNSKGFLNENFCNTDSNITNRKTRLCFDKENYFEMKKLNEIFNENKNVDLNVSKTSSNLNHNKINLNHNRSSKDNKVIHESNKNFRTNPLENFDEKELKDKIHKYLKYDKDSKKKFIKFTMGEFFKLLLCCKSFKTEELLKKEKIFDSVESKIVDYFDILTYTRFHEEFEKLKSFIFDPHQLYAFEFTRSRKISEILRMRIDQRIFESVKHFKRKFKENDLSESDRILLNSLNREFTSYIDLTSN